MGNLPLGGKALKHPDMAAAIGEYIDLRKADGMDYGAIAADLGRRGNAVISPLRCRQLHTSWNRNQHKAAAKIERRETGLVEEITPSTEPLVEDVDESPPSAIDPDLIGSASMMKMLRHLAEDLVERKPQWYPSCRPSLPADQTWQQIKGPGTIAGVSWLKQAVVITRGDEVVKVYPEHRMRRAYKPDSRCNTSMLRCNRPPRLQLYLEVLSLERPSHTKAHSQLKDIEAALKRGLMTPRARGLMEAQRQRLLAKLDGTDEGAKPRLRTDSILTRLATVMDLYLPGVTGFANGVEIAEATGRSRAAVSAQKLGLVRQDTRATSGRSGFEQVRAAGRHRQMALAGMDA